MIDNDHFRRTVRPDLAEPTMADATQVIGHFHMLPKPIIEARAVSNAVLFLASDEAQYITGASLPIDAGAVAKFLRWAIEAEVKRFERRGAREGLRVRFVGFGHAVQQR